MRELPRHLDNYKFREYFDNLPRTSESDLNTFLSDKIVTIFEEESENSEDDDDFVDRQRPFTCCHICSVIVMFFLFLPAGILGAKTLNQMSSVCSTSLF